MAPRTKRVLQGGRKAGSGARRGCFSSAPLIRCPMARALCRGSRCCCQFRWSRIPTSRSAYRLLDLLIDYSSGPRNDGSQERIA